MPKTVDAEVKGLIEQQKRMIQIAKDLHGAPLVKAIADSAIYVTEDAQRFAPVDTGRLRASITIEVKTMTNEILGVVGSDVEYAPYQEFGTKFMQGRFYLTNAFKKNAAAIRRRIEMAIGRIIK